MNLQQFNILECFRPADLLVPWHDRRVRVPDSVNELTKATHLDVAHFTSSTVIPTIRKLGLLPGAGTSRSIADGLHSEPDAVYLASGVDKFYFERAVKAHGGVGVAVVVRVPMSLLRADANILTPRSGERPDDLEALHSSLLAGACRHAGPISPSSILAVVDETGLAYG